MRIGFDAQNLYLQFYMEETLRGRRADAAFLRNNIVEAFLNPEHDHESYYHVELNMLGECFTERILRGNRVGDWNSAARTAVSVERDSWKAGMTMPLASLGVKTIRPGDVWGVNFVRTRFVAFGELHYSSAAPCLPRFRCPELFGHLAFDRAFYTLDGFYSGNMLAGDKLEFGISLTKRTAPAKPVRIDARVVFPSGIIRTKTKPAQFYQGEPRQFFFSFGAAEGGVHDFCLTVSDKLSGRILYCERRAISVPPLVKILPEQYFYYGRENPRNMRVIIGARSCDLRRYDVVTRIMPEGNRKTVWRGRITSVRTADCRQEIAMKALPEGKYAIQAELIDRQTRKTAGIDRQSFYKIGCPGKKSIPTEETAVGKFTILRGMEVGRLFGRCDGVVLGEDKRLTARLLCHPDWLLGATAEEIMRLDGFDAMEVYNLMGKTVWTKKWDYLLSHGRRIWAVASDDAHNVYSDSGKGWIVAKLTRVDCRSVINAVKAGRFYASNGPALESIFYDHKHGALHVVLPEGTDECRINFIGINGRKLQSHKGVKAAYHVTEAERYVRVELVDSKGKRAWSQPFFMERGRVRDPYQGAGSWYKGNLHTHTTCSVNDGMTNPVEVAEWYRNHGYGFVAITDHEVMTK